MDFKELINYGALGVVILWFMLRFEPRIKELTSAVNRLSQLYIIELTARGDLPPRRPISSARATRSPAIDELLAKLKQEIEREMEEAPRRIA
ncbi:MAG TPA: hypothetical protein VJ464_16835 [Blastocatellia bacterium]|nr:hypothetical protein [Blastocatellia bacterium]